MSYMASIYGITRYELWELIQMQTKERQGHLVQHTPTTGLQWTSKGMNEMCRKNKNKNNKGLPKKK